MFFGHFSGNVVLQHRNFHVRKSVKSRKTLKNIGIAIFCQTPRSWEFVNPKSIVHSNPLYLYMLRSSSFFNVQERHSKMHDLSMRKVLPFLWQICVHYQFSISPSRPNSQSLLETKWWLLSVARWFWLLLLTY